MPDSTTVQIRNNSLGLRMIGDVKILPGEIATFQKEDLRPYIGNLAFQHAFKSRQLEEIDQNAPPTFDPLSLRENAGQPPKPDTSKPGEGTPINVKDAAALANFLQGDQPANPPAV